MASFQPYDESLLSRLETHLKAQGYSHSTIDQYMAEDRRFLKYIAVRDIGIEGVKPLHVSEYLRCELRRYGRRYGHQPRSRTIWRQTRGSCVHMLLRIINGRWPPLPLPATPCDVLQQQICDHYAQWLFTVRGLAATSIHLLVREAARFVAWLGERVEERMQQLTGTDIDAYVISRAPSLCRRSQQSKAQYLRTFLRYLRIVGRVNRDLALCVVTPTLYALESIPSALRADEVQAVVDATKQDRSAKGLRDYAILLLLATYGLRLSEVTHLRLEDVDWRKGILTIHRTKTHSESYLPLLEPVGQAILAYLRTGRPKTPAREIFVRAYAPYRPLCQIYALIQSRLHAATVCPAGRRGSHAFRHARAVSMLSAGNSMKQIGEILGHRSASATMIYLKLDTNALRDIALGIPGEVKSS